jgi:uncharacterized protein (DUF2141 family)
MSNFINYKNILCVGVLSLFIFFNGCKSSTDDVNTETVTTDEVDTVIEDEETNAPEVVIADTSFSKKHKAQKEKAVVMEKKAIAKKLPLTLIIENLASVDGPIFVGVYSPENKFPDPKDQLKEYTFKPKGKKYVARISDLKFGTYAIAIYQDENSNGKIDKNFIGIPTEGYAFSNNFKPTVKAPGFDNCRFNYDSANHIISMKMLQ